MEQILPYLEVEPSECPSHGESLWSNERLGTKYTKVTNLELKKYKEGRRRPMSLGLGLGLSIEGPAWISHLLPFLSLRLASPNQHKE